MTNEVANWFHLDLEQLDRAHSLRSTRTSDPSRNDQQCASPWNGRKPIERRNGCVIKVRLW